MKFLTGKPFPSFEEWLEINHYLETDASMGWYALEKVTFREGCMREAIELFRSKKYPAEFKALDRQGSREGKGLEFNRLYNFQKWVANQLEASLDE